MHSLYQKYRPQRFSEVKGQEQVVGPIIEEIKSGAPAHAYLFSGPRGIGKTTVARILSRAVNCLERAANVAEPCNTCASCHAILHRQAIDVIEIDAASHTGVDNVRETIIENVHFPPTRAKKRVFIIDEVHMLSTASFNALLKTLEEPPEHTIFILATTELHKLPPTVISRCERFTFTRPNAEMLMGRLRDLVAREGKSISDEVLLHIVRTAAGSVRDAETLLGQVFAGGIEGEQTLQFLAAPLEDEGLIIAEALSNGAAEIAMAKVHEVLQRGVDYRALFDELLHIFRLALFGASFPQHPELLILPKEFRGRVIALAAKIDHRELVRALDVLMKRRQDVKHSPIPQLPLELALVEIGLRQPPPVATTKPRLDEILGELSQKNVAPAQVAPPSTATTEKSTVAIDEIRAGWEGIIKKVAETDPSFPIILTATTPHKMTDNTLVLETSFPFHRDKVCEIKNRSLIEGALKTLFSVVLKVDCVVRALPAGAVVDTNEPAVNTLLETFGGRVVE